MTLSPNDVNIDRQEAYVLIPLGARKRRPGFWNWPAAYVTSPTHHDELAINLIDLGHSVNSRIYEVPERREFRLCTDVYRLGPSYVGCILVVAHLGGTNYSTSVVCTGEPGWRSASAALTDTTPSGTKSWGYA